MSENGKKVLAMAEYIEREAAIAWFMPYAHTGESIDADVVISDIKGMKAADVAPVRHGRWVNANSRPKTYERRCTACGGRAYFCGIGCSYKYCPNCGAKMDLEG